MSDFLQSGQHPGADQVSAFVDHALPAHEREEMLAHLAVCAECREIVALSLPPIQAAAVASEREKRRWFRGLMILAPTAAVAGLAAVLLITHFAKSSRDRNNVPEPRVALQTPTAPPRTASTPPAPAERPAPAEHPKENAKQPQSKEKYVAAVNSPPTRPAAPAGMLRPVEGKMEPPEIVGSGLGGLEQAPNLQPAAPPEVRLQGGQPTAAEDQGTTSGNQSLANLQLPGGAALLSAVARGGKILAIDAENAVFLSNDGGATWVPVKTPWRGRAVKAEVVSYPVSGDRRERYAMAPRVEFAGAAPSAAPPAPSAQTPPAAATPAAPSGASTQTTPVAEPAPAAGSLSGKVTDRTGAVIPHATVAVTDRATHTSRTTETDGNGRFRFAGLAPGSYNLEARSPGFMAAKIDAVQIAASTANETNLTLEVGTAAETVTVQAANSAVETTSPELSENIKLKAARSAALAARAEPVFQITTENGDRWTSEDGVTWRRR